MINDAGVIILAETEPWKETGRSKLRRCEVGSNYDWEATFH
jgi:hypothetical protein